jgi:hypothetical protein
MTFPEAVGLTFRKDGLDRGVDASPDGNSAG